MGGGIAGLFAARALIKDKGLDWRRCIICRDGERVRMDIYEASDAEAVPDAVEVDLRA